MSKFRKKKSYSNLIAAISIFLLLIFVAVVAYTYINKIKDIDEIDKVTFCSKTKSYDKHVILLDITEKYNFVQVNDIKNNIEKLIKELAIGEKLEIYFLKDKVSEKDIPALEVCNPNSGDNSDFLFSNPRLLKKNWNEKFYQPLMNTMNVIDEENEYNSSPILEMIQWINVRTFKPNVDSTNKLTIVSDMIQNSKNVSFFKDNISKLNNDANTKFITNMNNVEVNLLVIYRNKYKKFQTKQHIEFWLKYFTKQKALVNTIKRIDG